MADATNDNQRQHQAKLKASGLKPCPVCRKPSTVEAQPFCSKRCADIDLHRWLGGVYAVPSDSAGAIEDGED